MEKLHNLLETSKKMCVVLRSYNELHPYTVIHLEKLEASINEFERALKEI